ncbi:thioredoxin family protein [Companilactobacillus mishanensis]|uniref:Thioredoxin family protein n=1 Tax=Companilactobacillus mishanensis TaxID=2486008 RepID=A0A5P0ZK91_9LACO|nr:thioredoxin family protein [Companilactobacillus mishanensis]MQS53499.1 thioredoxin family protein [Companilactobacillus mishanensis]MQS90271.1 thioredoxin family protein [Companilactobacillus mishanensis]
MIKTLTTQNFTSRDTSKVNVLNFSNDWCSQCYMENPIITAAADKYDSKLNFYTINADNNPDLVERYDIMTAPTIIIEKNDHIEYRATTFLDKKQLDNLLRYYL